MTGDPKLSIFGFGIGGTAGAVAAMVLSSAAQAENSSFCVTCIDPDRIYVCRVQGPDVDVRTLQYYCIARTASDGGHKFCGTSRTPPDSCAGAERTFVYDASEVSPALEAASEPPPVLSLDQPRRLLPRPSVDDTPAQNEDSETVVESGEAPQGPMRRVQGAVKATGETVGGIARTTGRRVGTAARTTVQCVRTLFRDCAPAEAP